jgi:hypothetical protein
MTSAWIVRSSSIVVAFTVLLADPSLPVGGDDAPQANRPAAPLAELWVDPGDISRRDAFYGPGGPESVPPADAPFEVQEIDTTGYSGGYTVKDAAGREWDVKVGAEAQPEVVTSRVLWLTGYHQPIVHFLASWKRRGDEGRDQVSGRFRLQSDHDTGGEWAWRENPFVGTRELKGLVVINLIVNNWDFKTSNNRIYTFEGESPGPRRWFVVQDVGASLGRSGWPMGTRNDIEAFESQRFVSLDNGAVVFDYRGRHREVLEDITAADVVWACRLLQRISDQQWTDLFRAAAYPAAVAGRYRTHLAAKIAEGLALEPASRVKP